MNQPVSTLNLPANLTVKLEQAGFHNCLDVTENLEKISQKLQIPEWTTATQAPEAKTALDLLEEESNIEPIQTLIPELDKILPSMVLPGTITEFCGFPGTGKTQICMHLAVGVQDVVFIHTNKNLNPERLREICQKSNDDNDIIMEKIFCIEASDPVEILASVEYLQTWLQSHTIRLLLIDSISWPLRQQDLSERAKLTCTLFQRLRVLSRTHNFAIILTNDLTTRVIPGKLYNTSAFGDSFYHLVNNRILLAKIGDYCFSAMVLKSVSGSRDVISFKI